MKFGRHATILASAGTGKTFQLANRFIGLLARNPSLDPASILAATFTRKAAGEILERILRRLAVAARSEAEAIELDQHLGTSCGRKGFETLAARIARQLHRLGIGTLDAFTAKLIGALGMDFGLPPGWRIAEEDEDRRLRIEAADFAIARTDRDLLRSFIDMWYSGGFGRGSHSAVLEIIKSLYEPFLLTRGRPDAWQVVQVEVPPLDAEQIRELTRRMSEVNPRLKGCDSRLGAAHAGALEIVKERRFDDLLKSSFCKGILSKGTYYGKPLPPGLLEICGLLVDHASSLRIAQIAKRNWAAYALIERFDVEYARLKRERGLYRFDDLPRHIISQPLEELLGRLYFRLDAQVKHLLLDEFQDTSGLQFEMLSPLCEELLSQDDPERSFFCVGDVKQSLYSWRGAEPQLLAELPSRWPIIETAALSVSHRSSQVVLDAVNKVFCNLRSNAVLCAADPGQENPGAQVAESWTSRYTPHAAAKQSLAGYVRISCPAESQDENKSVWSRQRNCMALAAQRVGDLLSFAPHARVAVLVRRNARIPEVIFELRQLGIDASEEGQSVLTDAAPVAAAASLFHLADFPDDTAALFHVGTSPIAQLMGIGTDELSGHARRLEAGARVSVLVRRRLLEVGFRGVCLWLLDELTPSMDDRGRRRFEQMVDVAGDMDARRAPQASHFAVMLRERPVEEPQMKQVRVMTIHKAKGLEFDGVVLPDLAENWHLKNDAVLIDRVKDGVRSPFLPVSAVSIHAGESLSRTHSVLGPMLDANLMVRYSDQLSMLYVAMTRAIHSLDIVLPPASSASKALSTANVLCAAFGVTTEDAAGKILYESGTPRWEGTLRREAIVHRQTEALPVTIRPGREAPIWKWGRRSPSSLEGGAGRTLGSMLTIEPAHGLERGSLIHAWCEEIGWLEDGVPRRERLLEIATALGWSLERSQKELDQFLKLLKSPGSAIFRRSRLAGSGANATVRREWAFATTATHDQERVVLAGQIDRLVTWERDGRVEGAEVIDFKTDNVSPEGLWQQAFLDRVEHYSPQIRAYGAAVSKLFRIPQNAVRLTLFFTESASEVRVDR